MLILAPRRQGLVEMVDWSDGWQGDLKDKVNGKQGCIITDKHGKVLLGRIANSGTPGMLLSGLQDVPRCKHYYPR